MKIFTYRNYRISARAESNYDLNCWTITIEGINYPGPRVSYNLDLEQSIPRKWWWMRHWDAPEISWELRCFEDALQSALAMIDRRHVIRAKEKDHYRLMEARLSLAEELLLP